MGYVRPAQAFDDVALPSMISQSALHVGRQVTTRPGLRRAQRLQSELKRVRFPSPSKMLARFGWSCRRRTHYKRLMTESTFGGRSALQAAFAHALSYLESQDQAPVGPRDDTDALRGRIFRKLEAEPTDPATVIEELVQDVEGGLLRMSGGRFYGWAIGGSLPAALAADWLTSAWDQNAALYACSPAAAIVEEVVGAWLKELLNIPPPASFALVTGCQMAHVTCLAAARHALLARVGWGVEDRGLRVGFGLQTVTAGGKTSKTERTV